MTSDPRDTLRVALDPRSIAVVGASENPDKIGGRPIAFLSRFGFRGPVYPINPARDRIQGLRAYPSLAALPEAPELVVIAVPGDLAVAAVDDCAAAGVKVVVLMASGFGETADPQGRAREQAMAARARAAGMRLVGPNSQGLANFGTGAVPSFSTMFVEVAPADGPVGIVSQSGAMSVIPYGLLRRRGIGVRHAHATGNDADVSVCELATLLVEDPGLKLLLLYLEGIPDPWNLAEAARVARRRGLPIVVLKSGRSPAGQAAARSHTGALANEDRVVDAFLEDHGIWRVRGTAELVEAAELYLKGWSPRGRGLVSVSNSGAVCVLSADAATDAGLAHRPLADATQAELCAVLPGFATVTNPVDITAALLGNSALFGAILPTIARDPAADAILVGIAVAGAGYDVEAFARDSAAVAAQTGRPLVAAVPQASVAERFVAHGIATFATEGEAVRALGQFVAHHERMREALRQDVPPPPRPAPGGPGGREIGAQPEPPEPGAGRASAGSGQRPASPGHEAAGAMLDEAASLALLRDAGVPVVRHLLCRSQPEAIDAFAALRAARVVVKGCTGAVAHKSELGLVRLGVTDADGAAAAHREIHAAARAAGVSLVGTLVAEQVRGARELMIGAHVDPVFGPLLRVGDGGRHVEAMPDAQVLLPPFDAARVERALRRLRIAPLLDGVRGEPPLDVGAFCEAAVAAGRLVADRTSGIASIDVNPVIVGARGEGCVAVDAVVFRSKGTP